MGGLLAENEKTGCYFWHSKWYLGPIIYLLCLNSHSESEGDNFAS